jgi:hypothetical protein
LPNPAFGGGVEQRARYVLRQSLIDLAAVAELAAGELPTPQEVGRGVRRGGWNIGS